jgi:hypothetical protein
LSDIFREVEEDVRREKLEKFWKAYGVHVMALLALVLIGVAGFELWQRQEAIWRDKDSQEFIAAQRITNPVPATRAFANLAKTAHGGYALLAKMEQADALALSGQTAQAVTLYKQIADQDHGQLGAAARIRGGWAMADTAPRADLQSFLQPLLDPANAWRQMAQEILAYSDYHQGKTLVAAEEFTKLAADPGSPDQLRSRAQAFAAFLSGGGAGNYGTVPPPAPLPASVPAPGGAPGAAPVTATP